MAKSKKDLIIDYDNIDYNNEKISEFLGWFKQKDELDSTWFINDGIRNIPIYSLDNYKRRDLPFHRDWNYLMQALNKIRSWQTGGPIYKNNEMYLVSFEINSYSIFIEFTAKINKKFEYYHSFHRYVPNEDKSFSDSNSEIEVVYKGVVDFVLFWDYYKKNKKDNKHEQKK